VREADQPLFSNCPVARHADLLSEHATIDEKEDVQMSEQPRKVKNEAIPD
jgi:hypothetical protein